MDEHRDEPQGEVSDAAADDASAVGWHGRSADYDLPVTPWRPVQTVQVSGDRL